MIVTAKCGCVCRVVEEDDFIMYTRIVKVGPECQDESVGNSYSFSRDEIMAKKWKYLKDRINA
jgi:hypothetical protein